MTLFKDEKVVIERNYDAVLPTLLMIIGVIIMVVGGILGLVVIVEEEDPGLLIVGLVLGGILLAVGKYLKEKCSFRLVVTTKRVVQDGPFNQFITLPLSHISGISVNGNQLRISAASIGILVGIPDSMSVCDKIAGLMNQLQAEAEPQQPAPVPVPVPQTSVSQPVAPDPEEPVPDASVPRQKRFTCAEEDVIISKGICPDCGAELQPSDMDGIMMCPECGRMFG